MINNCPSDETISRFADGELEKSEEEQVIEHFDSCRECREKLAVTINLLQALDQIVNQNPRLDTFNTVSQLTLN